MKKEKCLLLLCSAIICCLFNAACNPSSHIKVEFTPLSEYAVNDTAFWEVDMENAILNGIEIPTPKQTPNGFFNVDFEFTPEKGKQYFYKIYYQNETYKFPETNSLCAENFYGSWEDCSITFKPVLSTDGNVSDNIRIVGNPRDEKLYYGSKQLDVNQINERIGSVKNNIYNTPEWVAAIQEKAKANKVSEQEQVYADALWIIEHDNGQSDENHRWKRNPRMGCYKFMLVLVEESALKSIPEHIADISKTTDAGVFENPFSYFLYGKGKTTKGVHAILSDQILKVKATLNPMSGIYVDPFKLKQEFPDTQYFTSLCNEDTNTYKHAHFAQYFHSIDRNFQLRNIPEIRDVLNDPYTRTEYFKGIEKYKEDQLVYDHTYNAKNACENIWVDSVRHGIVLRNKGNIQGEHPRKQNVGIISRIGFNYGIFRGKIKFPEMLNDEFVWNGLTNAFWLIFQGEGEWAMRRPSKDGYIPKHLGGEASLKQKVPRTYYSEIDIEIVKAAYDWMEHDIQNNGNGFDNGNVMFTCTNWDLASKDPTKFSIGQSSISYQETAYTTFRWDDYYKALSLKTPIPDDELFKPDYYYYEIEWRPTEIIWRVGPSPDKMRVCGYMNDQVTMIPNNQMLCIVTQEFHYAEWWPAQPYSQNYVPYPKNDIEGIVYEVVIE